MLSAALRGWSSGLHRRHVRGSCTRGARRGVAPPDGEAKGVLRAHLGAVHRLGETRLRAAREREASRASSEHAPSGRYQSFSSGFLCFFFCWNRQSWRFFSFCFIASSRRSASFRSRSPRSALPHRPGASPARARPRRASRRSPRPCPHPAGPLRQLLFRPGPIALPCIRTAPRSGVAALPSRRPRTGRHRPARRPTRHPAGLRPGGRRRFLHRRTVTSAEESSGGAPRGCVAPPRRAARAPAPSGMPRWRP